MPTHSALRRNDKQSHGQAGHSSQYHLYLSTSQLLVAHESTCTDRQTWCIPQRLLNTGLQNKIQDYTEFHCSHVFFFMKRLGIFGQRDGKVCMPCRFFLFFFFWFVVEVIFCFVLFCLVCCYIKIFAKVWARSRIQNLHLIPAVSRPAKCQKDQNIIIERPYQSVKVLTVILTLDC